MAKICYTFWGSVTVDIDPDDANDYLTDHFEELREEAAEGLDCDNDWFEIIEED